MELKNNDEDREETRGRPTKGYYRMEIDRKVRLDREMDRMLVAKCKRLGVAVADGIREGIKLFLMDKRY